jgi:hypothetical protein
MKGEGKQSADIRSVSSFNAIVIDVPLNASITIKEGAQPSVQLSGYENLLQHIKTEIKGDTLHIFVPEGWDISADDDISAKITMPSLAALALSGRTNTDIHGTVSGPKFDIDISGSGDVRIDNINVSDFSTSVSGAADIVIKAGNAAHATYDISGAGDIKGFSLQTSETVATLSGAGVAEVNAQRRLESHINGTGSIRYKGHPVLVSDIAGIGTVTDVN